MRPKCICRHTLRLPEELERALIQQAELRRVSVSEVIICACENELARLLTYHLDFYAELIPVLLHTQLATNRTLADNGGPHE